MAEAANFELVVFKHVCKFCKKSFPCGRSLGGHMRSHLSSSSSSSSSDRIVDDQGKLVIIPIKNKKNKDSSKKTWRSVAEESSDDHDHDQEDHALRSCRECGKVFQSSKALFGHMKSTHSQKERLLNNNTNNHHSLVDEYWGSGASNQKLEAHLDSPSENDESTVAPPAAANANRLRRSSRRRGRYMGTATTSSSMSLANNNASSSVSEIDQHEQEEVALCLIMLSKDMGQWGGSCSFPNTLNSPTAAAEIKNSLSLEAEKKTVGKGKNCTFSSSEVDNTKLKRQASSYECFYSGGGGGGRSKMEFSTSGNLKNRPKIRKSQVSDHGYARDDDQENKCKLKSGDHEIEVQLRKELSSNNGGMLFRGGESGTTKGNIQWKRKLSDICDESDKSEKISKLSSDGKRIKFECATCNKVFNSYQALGGHRASHKKIKGCSSLKPESNELDCLETAALSPPRLKADGKLEQTTETVNGPKKDQKHECPICFKVFLSGQALGGHKRSHQIAGLEATTSNHHQGIAFQKPTQEIREFLDLNLPAPVEDVGLSPWWHEPLLGLISETI